MDSRQFKDAAKASIDHSKPTFPEDAVTDHWLWTWNHRPIH